MLSKKHLALTVATVATIAICGNTFAGHKATKYQQTNQYAEQADGSGVTLGANYATYGGNDFAVMLGYITPKFSGNFGVSFEDTNPNGPNNDSHTTELRADIGLRRALHHHLYFTYGALGTYGVRSPSSTATRTSPWAVGAYMGLDFQPLHHLLLSFKLSPYTYYVDYARITHNDVFSDGSIQLSYIFC